MTKTSSEPGPAVTLIVPAYNEAESLPSTMPALVAFVRERGWRLVVVDDGSEDATSEVLSRYHHTDGVLILRNKVRRGYGGAIKAGIRAVTTDLLVTVDADGQHRVDDIETLYRVCLDTGADMVIGDRGTRSSLFREFGKRLIRMITRLLMPLPVRDLNSGMKLYRADLAKRYIPVCPDSMAFSDVIALVFLHERHLVKEQRIETRSRAGGRSTITTLTAFETVMAILNIIVLFNPMRVFLPLSIAFVTAGVAWGLPIVVRGLGVSPGALLAIVTGVLFFALGLIAEQLSALRKMRTD